MPPPLTARPQLRLLGNRIHASTNIKMLGVEIDQHLSFSGHINGIINKCIGKIKFLWRHARSLSQDCRKLLYIAIVSPHLQYCDVVWRQANISLLNKLEKVQNQGLKFILNNNSNKQRFSHIDEKSAEPNDSAT